MTWKGDDVHYRQATLARSKRIKNKIPLPSKSIKRGGKRNVKGQKNLLGPAEWRKMENKR